MTIHRALSTAGYTGGPSGSNWIRFRSPGMPWPKEPSRLAPRRTPHIDPSSTPTDYLPAAAVPLLWRTHVHHRDCLLEAQRLGFVLEAKHDIVCISHNDHVSSRAAVSRRADLRWCRRRSVRYLMMPCRRSTTATMPAIPTGSHPVPLTPVPAYKFGTQSHPESCQASDPLVHASTHAKA